MAGRIPLDFYLLIGKLLGGGWTATVAHQRSAAKHSPIALDERGRYGPKND